MDKNAKNRKTKIINKLEKIIPDIFLFGFLALLILSYLFSLDGVKEGIPNGFYREGYLLYGVEAYLDNLSWVALGWLLTGLFPLTVIYDLIFLIVKLVNKKLKIYQLIVITATYLLLIVGVILINI